MQEMEIFLVGNLPPFTPREPDAVAEAGRAEAMWDLMTQIYAQRMRLDRLHPGAGAHLFYPAAVAFTGGDGIERIGYAAAIGRAGEGPLMTIFISNDIPPSVTMAKETKGWIDFYGDGELPDQAGPFPRLAK